MAWDSKTWLQIALAPNDGESDTDLRPVDNRCRYRVLVRGGFHDGGRDLYAHAFNLARHAADNALVTEPNLPKIIHKPMDLRAAQVVFDRMQHRFSDISFLVHGQELLVTSTDGSKFRQWLTALSYMDTISPEFHWSITSFCVGKCTNMELMRAAVTGERISFETPPADAKE